MDIDEGPEIWGINDRVELARVEATIQEIKKSVGPADPQHALYVPLFASDDACWGHGCPGGVTGQK